jgi:hypothetical protein
MFQNWFCSATSRFRLVSMLARDAMVGPMGAGYPVRITGYYSAERDSKRPSEFFLSAR